MSENAYEGMFILDSNRYVRESAELAARIPKLIEKQGGTILVNRLWEERRLAYPIRGHRKGTYWLTYFRLDGAKLAALDEQIRRTDAVLRHLLLKVDPRIVEALVEHATSGSRVPPPAEEPGRPREGAAAGKTRPPEKHEKTAEEAKA